MITVENFYWVLFENLLKPSGLDCWYYYPWGTKDNLSRQEFRHPADRHDYARSTHHVFFHFDQEPLWTDQLGIYDQETATWNMLFAKILANSEHSCIKKQVCKERGFLDWYFFYHGFVALDWYRDACYIQTEHPVNDAFLSLNHMLDQRLHRLALVGRLLDKNIAKKGSISLHTSVEKISKELYDTNTNLSETSKMLIQQNMTSLSGLPWILDKVHINGTLSARFGHEEYKMWQSSLWHLVTETVF